MTLHAYAFITPWGQVCAREYYILDVEISPLGPPEAGDWNAGISYVVSKNTFLYQSTDGHVSYGLGPCRIILALQMPLIFCNSSLMAVMMTAVQRPSDTGMLALAARSESKLGTAPVPPLCVVSVGQQQSNISAIKSITGSFHKQCVGFIARRT